jgi:hypothetical protein
MLVLKILPDTAFVKGGLFKKFGVDLPKPGLQICYRRREAWEMEIQVVKCIE